LHSVYLFNFQDFRIADFIWQSTYICTILKKIQPNIPLDWFSLEIPPSPGYVTQRRMWIQRRVSQSDVQFLLIKPLKSGRMCLRLHPLLLRYFKCQKSCQAKRKIAIEPEMIALLARGKVVLSLSKGHSALGGGDWSPFDNLQTNQNTIACHQESVEKERESGIDR